MLTRLLVLLLLTLLPMHGVFAEAPSISGQVTYRERVALPKGSTLAVRLVALPGAHPVASASSPIPPDGAAPFQFSLSLRTEPAPSAAYGLIAEIRSGSGVVFRTPAPVPVDLGASAPVTIILARHLEASPPEAEEPTVAVDPGLLGVNWQVTSIGAVPVAEGRPLTLAIAPDLRVDGHAGCNDYFTQASGEDGALSFGQAATTRKACSAQVMEQESAFFAALSAIASYEIESDSLRLLDAAGIPLIGLVRSKD